MISLLAAVATLGGLALGFGALLGYASKRFRVEGNPMADKIEHLLPQTQCGQCGYAGCRPYAEAIAKGEADINLCPPGGEAVIKALAELLGVEPKPLDESKTAHAEKRLAVIDENTCIGCTLCIQACPVDAILGAAKQMHTVIAPECTGCALCVPPCPVECIHMVAVEQGIEGWKWPPPAPEQPTAPSAQAKAA